MSEVFWRSGFNYDRDAASNESGLECKDVSLTVQSQKDEADINTIVKRFGLTGQLPQNVPPPPIDVFVDVLDYRSCLDAIREADRAFLEMPAEVRARFQNDPAQFVDFCSNKDNLEEMRKLGLAVPKAEAPTTAPVDAGS